MRKKTKVKAKVKAERFDAAGFEFRSFELRASGIQQPGHASDDEHRADRPDEQQLGVDAQAAEECGQPEVARPAQLPPAEAGQQADMKISAVRLVTKTPCRLQKMKAGFTASNSAVALAASGPPRRQATRQVTTRVERAGEQRQPAQRNDVHAPDSQKRHRQNHVQRADIVLHHQRQPPRPELDRGVAKGRHRLAGDQLHRVQPGLLGLIIVQARQLKLVRAEHHEQEQASDKENDTWPRGSCLPFSVLHTESCGLSARSGRGLPRGCRSRGRRRRW